MRAFLPFSFFLLSVLLYSAPAAQSAPDESASGGNVFNVPQESAGAKFTGPDGKAAPGRGEKVPGWAEIRMIPSLSGEKRKLVQELFNKAKADSGPLQEKMRQLRQEIDGQQVASANTGGANSNPAAGSDGAGQSSAGQNGGAGPRPHAKPSPEQKARMAELRNQMRDIRVKTWEQVKPMLSEEDLHNLDLMKEGKLLPENLQRRQGGNAGAGDGNHASHRRQQQAAGSDNGRGNTDGGTMDDGSGMQDEKSQNGN